MIPEHLLAHFDRISEAPGAIPRLRRFVLDLAVRGKLVEQDSKDEPASELLKQIEEEDVRNRTASSTISAPRNAIEIPIESLPFNVPASWRWARLIKISVVSYGFAFESSRFNSRRNGMPLIRIRDISGIDTQAYYEGDFDQVYIVRKGDYLVGMDGDFNVRKWKGPDALLNQRVMRIKNWRANLAADFLAIPLQMILEHLHTTTSQTTVKHLSAKQANGIYLPLPPLAEQHRIVAKVDELMALCDRLEAAQAERENRRDRLAAASLNRLNNGTDAKFFREHARFHLRHLPRLTSRPEHIKQLRQTILNLAVRGRLVPQDPNDESASDLLKRIQVEKARLVKGGKIRKQLSPPLLASDEIPFYAPMNWTWLRVAEIGFTQTGTTPSSNNPEYFGNHIPFVKPADLTGLSINYSGEGIAKEGVRFSRLISTHSVLMVCIGSSIGKVNVTDRDVCCNQQINTVTPYLEHLTAFTSYAMRASYFQQLVFANAGMGTLPIISKGKWEILPVPLPPLAEQHRIVAKVEELLALCDRLEAQLTTTQTESRRLLEATLHEALAGKRDHQEVAP